MQREIYGSYDNYVNVVLLESLRYRNFCARP